MLSVLRSYRLHPVRRWGLPAIVFFLAAGRVPAASPATIGFQGVLASPGSQPKPDGSYSLTFRLYNVETGGAALWTEAGRAVSVTGGKGAFSTVLGAPTPFGGLSFDQPLYLEVQAAGDVPMTPRIALRSVPYAMNSGNLSLPYTGFTTVPLTPAFAVLTNGAGGSAISATFDGRGDGFALRAWHYGSGGAVIRAEAFGATPAVRAISPNRAVWASSTGASYGLFAESVSGVGAQGQSGSGIGVSGLSTSAQGVYGNSSSHSGVHGLSGTGVGVYGESASNGQGTGNHGVFGLARVPLAAGVYGKNDAPSAWGVYGTSQGAGSVGVVGTASGDSSSKGVYGSTLSGYGIVGRADTANATAIRGESITGASGELGGVMEVPVGVIGRSSPGGWAGKFEGDVAISDRLVVSGNMRVFGSFDAFGPKNFRIDHPLDPANKTLTHSCAEGPEALNIYNGNVTTDADGEAVVTLPDYCEALNRDFRYQLTIVDESQFAQVRVARKISGNRFTIRTDRPNVEVSWQVTGVRNDAYMRTHPQPVEDWKPGGQRGKYIDPVSHGQPREKGIGYPALKSSIPGTP